MMPANPPIGVSSISENSIELASDRVLKARGCSLMGREQVETAGKSRRIREGRGPAPPPRGPMGDDVKRDADRRYFAAPFSACLRPAKFMVAISARSDVCALRTDVAFWESDDEKSDQEGQGRKESGGPQIHLTADLPPNSALTSSNVKRSTSCFHKQTM